jgi:hypothetical protein
MHTKLEEPLRVSQVTWSGGEHRKPEGGVGGRPHLISTAPVTSVRSTTSGAVQEAAGRGAGAGVAGGVGGRGAGAGVAGFAGRDVEPVGAPGEGMLSGGGVLATGGRYGAGIELPGGGSMGGGGGAPAISVPSSSSMSP